MKRFWVWHVMRNDREKNLRHVTNSRARQMIPRILHWFAVNSDASTVGSEQTYNQFGQSCFATTTRTEESVAIE